MNNDEYYINKAQNSNMANSKIFFLKIESYVEMSYNECFIK